MTLVSTVTTKGQMVIPAPIRKKLKIKPNDRMYVSVVNNKVMAYRAPTIDEMCGSIKSKIKMTDKQLEAAINKAAEQAAVERYLRSV